jgi:hypothetical protein
MIPWYYSIVCLGIGGAFGVFTMAFVFMSYETLKNRRNDTWRKEKRC